MSDEEVKIYENILLQQSDPSRPCDVLEWGAGGSTAHFSQVLETLGGLRTWLTIDHDPVWIDRARAASPAWVEFLCVPTGGDRTRPQLWADYVAPPALNGRVYDLILIDGRMRRRCLERAALLLRDSLSRVVLHDAWRPYYHPAFARFPRGRFLTRQVWVGQLADSAPGRPDSGGPGHLGPEVL
jgi:hypothetical protein